MKWRPFSKWSGVTNGVDAAIHIVLQKSALDRPKTSRSADISGIHQIHLDLQTSQACHVEVLQLGVAVV